MTNSNTCNNARIFLGAYGRCHSACIVVKYRQDFIHKSTAPQIEFFRDIEKLDNDFWLFFFPRLELNHVHKVLKMGLPIILWIFDGKKMRTSGSSNMNHRQNIEFPIYTWSPNLKMLIPPVDMSCRRAMPAENVDVSDMRPILNPLRLTHRDTWHRLLDTDSGNPDSNDICHVDMSCNYR